MSKSKQPTLTEKMAKLKAAIKVLPNGKDDYLMGYADGVLAATATPQHQQEET